MRSAQRSAFLPRDVVKFRPGPCLDLPNRISSAPLHLCVNLARQEPASTCYPALASPHLASAATVPDGRTALGVEAIDETVPDRRVAANRLVHSLELDDPGEVVDRRRPPEGDERLDRMYDARLKHLKEAISTYRSSHFPWRTAESD